MKNNELILKMIEEVDPNDMAKLDEIDARVLCWLHGVEWLGRNEITPSQVKCHGKSILLNETVTLMYMKRFTRSRDALKEIRPKGWAYSCEGAHGSWFSDLSRGVFYTTQFGMNTEELAELHAIVQAIAYERGIS